MGKIESREDALGGYADSRFAPVETAGNHQVQHQPETAIESQANAFPQASNFTNAFFVHRFERGVRRAQQKWARHADALQPLVQDPGLKGFNVDNYVGKLGHNSAILTCPSGPVKQMLPEISRTIELDCGPPKRVSGDQDIRREVGGIHVTAF